MNDAILERIARSLERLVEIAAQKPAASAPRARSAGTGWRVFEIPFGKQKGLTLGEIPRKSLEWWITNYKAEGYKGNPPRQSDLDLRAALDEAAGEVTSSTSPPTQRNELTEDQAANRAGSSVDEQDVPF